ncbi:MAG: OPT family oligopeptide transporter [Pseudomonadota bacterium]
MTTTNFEKERLDPEIVEEEEIPVHIESDLEHDASDKETLSWSVNEPQLTFRAILFGCLIGGIMGMSNIYMGLKAGWTEGGSIISAVLAFALAKALSPLFKSKFTILENNISQTTGSAAGCMSSSAGLVSAIPALAMLGVTLSYWQMTLWCLGVSLLGVFFAIPLREQMVVNEKLRFPTGTATAACIKAMHAAGNEALLKAKALLYMGIFSGIFTWFRDAKAAWMPFNIPNNLYFPCSISGVACKTLTLGINMSPMMFGAGLLIGPRVGASLAVGATICWAIIAPLLVKFGVIEEMSYRAIIRWSIWPGVALMVSTGIVSLLLQWKTVLRTFVTIEKAAVSKHRKNIEQIGLKLWIVGMLVAGSMAVIAAYYIFNIPVWMSIIAILLSSVLASVAVRATGETDINPVGGMGKITQLVYGLLAPGNMTTNLMAAAVTSAGASQSGDMMHDLKAGYLLGASPKKQLVAQLIGVLVGVFMVVPIYMLVTKAYPLGTETLPAPAAIAWSTMARVLAQGLSSLPPSTLHAAIIGAVLGTILTLLNKTSIKRFLPSGVAVGIAFIVPAYYCFSMFLGSLVLLYINKRHTSFSEKYSASIAAGGIAGEGIMGVIIAALLVAGLLG